MKKIYLSVHINHYPHVLGLYRWYVDIPYSDLRDFKGAKNKSKPKIN